MREARDEASMSFCINDFGNHAGKYIVGARKAGDRLTEGLKGTFAAAYSEQVASEIAVAAGVGWKPLMFFEGTDVPGVSVRRGADCTEVHIALPGAITAQFCRNLAKEAGFDPLVESDELLPFAQESANRDKFLIYERA